MLTPIDWSKPIRERRYGPRYWVKSTDYIREPGADPCVCIGQHDGPDLHRTLDNKHIIGPGAALVFENVPPEPVTKKTLVVFSRWLSGERTSRVNFDDDEAVIEITRTDGIVTDVRLVTPNKEPHRA